MEKYIIMKKISTLGSFLIVHILEISEFQPQYSCKVYSYLKKSVSLFLYCLMLYDFKAKIISGHGCALILQCNGPSTQGTEVLFEL